MDDKRIVELRKLAQELRIIGLEMVKNASSGHIGGAFSLSEILACLYFEKMNVKPENPSWDERDRLVLSKGHATVALYAVLARRGFFPLEKLKTFRHIEGDLSGHAEMRHVPGVDMSTGSLGQGLSAAVGMAVAARVLGRRNAVYAIVGDGELGEGQIWEACMYAGAKGLDNLTIIVDYNKLQLDGTLREILDTGDLAKKFESFGLNAVNADGHDVAGICRAIDEARATKGKATAIVADTVKGKGVSFMENSAKWHGRTPVEKEFAAAFTELRETLAGLEA